MCVCVYKSMRSPPSWDGRTDLANYFYGWPTQKPKAKSQVGDQTPVQKPDWDRENKTHASATPSIVKLVLRSEADLG